MPEIKIPIIVQARMNSARLPGKSLAMIEGKPSLGWLCGRLANSGQCGPVIVATSVEKSDDPIAEYCEGEGIKVYRGDLDNVASRFFDIVTDSGATAFVRICGDSPLLDWRLIDAGAEIFKSGKYDLVTNVLDRKFPKGESFEIVSAEIFRKAYPNFTEPGELEHVTYYFYQNREKYNIYSFGSDDNYSDINLCIDTADDYENIKSLAEKIGAEEMENIDWRNVVKICEES